MGSNPTLSASPRRHRHGAGRPSRVAARAIGVGREEVQAVSGTRKVAIALLALVLLAMWLAVVFNARTTVPVPL